MQTAAGAQLISQGSSSPLLQNGSKTHTHMCLLCLTHGVLNGVFHVHCYRGQQQTRQIHAKGLTSAGAENLSHLVQVNHFAQATKL